MATKVFATGGSRPLPGTPGWVGEGQSFYALDSRGTPHYITEDEYRRYRMNDSDNLYGVSRPTSADIESLQQYISNIPQPTTTTYEPVTWGSEQERKLKAETYSAAAPYIREMQKDINQFNTQLLGQAGYTNPWQQERLMSAKTGTLGTGIAKQLQAAGETARRTLQDEISEQNRAKAYAAQTKNQASMSAYQAAINALMNSYRG